MPHRFSAVVRPAMALGASAALVFATGCSSETDETSAPMTTASTATTASKETSTVEASTRVTASTSTSADSRILQPEEYEISGGKHAFRLKGSSDGCWFNSQRDVMLHCDLSLSDPPLVEDAAFPSPQPANMIGLASPESGFEYRYSPLEGGHNYDLKVLEPGQSLIIDGISCTAERATSMSCETRTESFEYSDGRVTSDAPGLNKPSTPESRASSDTSCPGIQMANGASITMEITGSTPMDCEEVRSVSGRYTEIITNMTQDDVAYYGNSGIREFDGWMCSAPSAGMAQSMGYMFTCSNDAEGKEFLSPI